MSCSKIIGRYKFITSKIKNKKYDAFIKKDGHWKKVASFGDKRYEHYKDIIGCYKRLDHGDSERRKQYRIRHEKDKITKKYKQGLSPGYFSMKYLW